MGNLVDLRFLIDVGKTLLHHLAIVEISKVRLHS